VIFLAGLIGDVVILERIGAPLMGVALLLGLATFASRLWASDPTDADEAWALPDRQATEPALIR
jgi:hypothetical protein